MKKQTVIGLTLIILGEVLYFIQSFISRNYNINDFISGFLLGASIGLNLIGIIVSIISISKNYKK